MDDALFKLIDAITKMAPQVWAVLLKQVYSEAISYLACAVVFTIVTFISIRISWKLYCKECDEQDDHYASALFGIIGIITAVLLLMFAVSAMQRLYNPDFYAIKFLLDQIPGK